MADDFDRFWAAYPKRSGANPKHPARLKFDAAVKRGELADVIIGSAGRYSAEQRKLSHLNTEYVAMAVTWLNQRRWQDYPAALDKVAQETVWIPVTDARWVYAVEAFKRAYRKSPPIVPGAHGLVGPGWHFPTALMVTGDARNANPADEASQRGKQSSSGVVPSNDLDQSSRDFKSAGQRGELSRAPNFYGTQVSEPPKDVAPV